MTVKERSQVGIVGSGPSGLFLSHLLALGGIESRVVEARSRAYCEARQRAGMLEPATARLLRNCGLRRRLDAEGLEHDGICRAAVPAGGLRVVARRSYPVSWLGILAQVPPSTGQVICSRHERGFALHSIRTPEVSRLYLQVPAGDDVSRWPDDGVWHELPLRLGVPGWELTEGPVLERGITGMRSLIAAPMRYGRLFLAGDAAHIVPRTGAKGLNLAAADVALLSVALTRLLRDGNPDLADACSAACEERAWRATHLSWWMTSMLHVLPAQDPFDSALQVAQLRSITTSRAAARMLADMYTGSGPAVRSDPSPEASAAALLAAGVRLPSAG